MSDVKPDDDKMTMADQAYQVIGNLLDHCGLFESDEGQRALDYFSEGKFDDSFLPWHCSSPSPTVADKLAEAYWKRRAVYWENRARSLMTESEGKAALEEIDAALALYDASRKETG